MFEKLIENWFRNANERAYQIPFAQVLAHEGHEVVYISTHGILEQGKDIITRDSKGARHAFQLKSGNISTSVWRKEVQPEMWELTTVPLVHPSLREDERAEFTPYLVCGGSLAEKVRNDLETLNQGFAKQGKARIKTITGGELLKRFISAQGRFLPSDPAEFNEFLTLMLWDGADGLPKAKLGAFLIRQLPLDVAKKPKKSELARALAANLLLFGYLLGPFANAQNHLAVAQGWLMFLVHAAAYAEAHKLAQNRWRRTHDLAFSGIEAASEALREEALRRKPWMEGYRLVDGPLIGIRTTQLAGWLGAWELVRATRSGKPLREDVIDRIRDELPFCQLVTEADAPSLLAAAWATATRGAETAKAVGTVAKALAQIVRAGGKGAARPGFPNAYYDAQWVVRFGLSKDEQEGHDDNFLGRSMTAGALVDWLARRMWRQTLANLWYELTAITMEEFIPDPATAWALWRSHGGELRQRQFGRPQSWASLQRAASSRSTTNLPQFLQNDGALTLLFVLTFPHRFNRDSLAVVEQRFGDLA